MILTKKEAELVTYEEHDDWDLVNSNITDRSRWNIHYECVYFHKPTEKHYRAYPSFPATDDQDGEPFDAYGDEIDFVEVHKVEKMVVAWEELVEDK